MTIGLIQYRLQQNGARRRGIDWQFTFEEWVTVWERSGKADQRGRGKGCYVMARHGDTGPYSASNVSIILFEQNCADAHTNGRIVRVASVLDYDFEAAPRAVDLETVQAVLSYREAVRSAWALRHVPNLMSRSLAELIGAYPSHVSDYLASDDAPSRRDLPARLIPEFEWVVGNTLVSQWLAAQTRGADRARADHCNPAIGLNLESVHP